MSEVDFNDVIVEEDVNTGDMSTPPLPSQPEWSDYVLSLLSEDERDRGYPKVDGLRRLLGVLVGDIEESGCQVLQCPQKENDYIATVAFTIKVDGKTFTAVADAGLHNTDPPYSKYPVAIAETRAEGRVLRRLLGLKTVVAEELSNVEAPTRQVSNDVESITINSNQVQMIETLAKRLDINTNKLVAEKFEGAYNKLSDVSNDGAKLLIKTLSQYQQDLNSIPESIKGN